MKTWITVVSVSVMIGAVGIASAQAPPPRKLRSERVQPLTPAETARFHQTFRLSWAASDAMHSGDYALAETYARQSIAAGPDSGLAQEVLAASLDAQNETQEALQVYGQIAAAKGSFPRNLLPYARLLLKAGNYQQAVRAYNEALPLLDDGEFMRERGEFSPGVPRPNELAAAIQTALGLEMDWRGYHGTYKEAIQQSQTHFQQALALEPNSSLANYYIGYGLKRLGRRAEAQAAFRKAADLGQGDIREAAEKELPEAERPK